MLSREPWHEVDPSTILYRNKEVYNIGKEVNRGHEGPKERAIRVRAIEIGGVGRVE